MKPLFAAAIGCALLTMAATSNPADPPVVPGNSECPVSGKAVNPKVSTIIKKNVGFC